MGVESRSCDTPLTGGGKFSLSTLLSIVGSSMTKFSKSSLFSLGFSSKFEDSILTLNSLLSHNFSSEVLRVFEVPSEPIFCF